MESLIDATSRNFTTLDPEPIAVLPDGASLPDGRSDTDQYADAELKLRHERTERLIQQAARDCV